MDYSLKLPHKVYSGENALEQIKLLVQGKFKKAAVFTDAGVQKSGAVDIPLAQLKDSGVEIQIFNDLPAEPTCDQAQEIIEHFRGFGADLILAIGGGSVMDVAKLASIAATDQYSVRDLLGDSLKGKKQIYSIMIPTTAGTGAEATPNSIVSVPERELKVGIVNEEMMPDVVILDGRMIRNLPKKIAAATGVDALCHAIECYTSNKANPFSNLFAMESMKLIFPHIVKACEDPDALEEKNKMMLAAFYGGVAIASSGTTAVHALSYPLGGKYHIAHGVSNAIMLLPVMRFNQPACQKEFAEIYDALGKKDLTDTEKKAQWIIDEIERILIQLELPFNLSAYHVSRDDLEDLVTAGMEVQRLLVNNKRTVTAEDAKQIYLAVL